MIEGVLALKIIAKLGTAYDYLIFIKLLNGFIGWDLGHYLEPRVKSPRSHLLREVAEYYRDFQPFLHCNSELSHDIHDR